ncbi:MAG: cation transporter [Clostridia bacterium]|nr:cation transporter [Clostridia bacterium]MBR7032381.1 cation transporter [Clostridia bacterium]
MFGKKNEITLSVGGMQCERCAARVKDALEAIGCRANVSLADGTAKIKYPAAVTREKLVETVEALGFKVNG